MAWPEIFQISNLLNWLHVICYDRGIILYLKHWVLPKVALPVSNSRQPGAIVILNLSLNQSCVETEKE